MDGLLRELVIARARGLFNERIVRRRGSGLMCFYWVAVGWVAMYECGIPAVIQGGRASWPLPNGGRASYPFEPSMTWQPGQPMVPIHAWLYVPTTKEIVDLAYGDLITKYESDGNRRWTWPMKSCLWIPEHDSRYEYVSHPEGVDIVVRVLADSFRFIR